MARRQIWQKPRLRTDEDNQLHRKVTWLELFFDLVFVVAIAQIAHHLSAHITASGVQDFFLLFLPIWWLWLGITYYHERFETEGLENRLFTFLFMVCVAGLAIFAHAGLRESFTGFALSYAAGRALLVFLWIRAGIHDPRARGFTTQVSIVSGW